MIGTGSGHPVRRRRAIFGVGCAALAVAFPSCAGAQASSSSESANGPNRSALASGSAQSPIDFREKEITFVDHLPRVRFSYPRSTDVTLVNTGSPDKFATVRADVPAGTAFITVHSVRYDLAQFHWHTPSEHTIEGQRAPLEMHLVHRKPNGSFLVIGIFIEPGRVRSAIDPIFRALPKQPGTTHDVPNVHLRNLLPHRRESFRYSGSLTIPPFTEGVDFIIFTNSISFLPQQIRAFRELFENGNNREVQPLNGREIRSDA